jgi:hypothetical protein
VNGEENYDMKGKSRRFHPRDVSDVSSVSLDEIKDEKGKDFCPTKAVLS